MVWDIVSDKKSEGKRTVRNKVTELNPSAPEPSFDKPGNRVEKIEFLNPLGKRTGAILDGCSYNMMLCEL